VGERVDDWINGINGLMETLKLVLVLVLVLVLARLAVVLAKAGNRPRLCPIEN
jgi:hypothetical protein